MLHMQEQLAVHLDPLRTLLQNTTSAHHRQAYKVGYEQHTFHRLGANAAHSDSDNNNASCPHCIRHFPNVSAVGNKLCRARWRIWRFDVSIYLPMLL